MIPSNAKWAGTARTAPPRTRRYCSMSRKDYDVLGSLSLVEQAQDDYQGGQ